MEPDSSSDYAQGPKEVIERFFYYSSVGNARGAIRMLGIEWEDEYERAYENWVMKYRLGKIRLEKLTGMEYENAERKISVYWLNNEDLTFESLYTVFDIQEIGRAYFHVSMHAEDEDFEGDIESYVVKTDLGWFVVPEEYLAEKE